MTSDELAEIEARANAATPGAEQNAPMSYARQTFLSDLALRDESNRNVNMIECLGEIERLQRQSLALVAAVRDRDAALQRLVSEWGDWTSQELYGEHIREGMDPEDFARWEEAHQAAIELLRGCYGLANGQPFRNNLTAEITSFLAEMEKR